jgi:hypothetical protein
MEIGLGNMPLSHVPKKAVACQALLGAIPGRRPASYTVAPASSMICIVSKNSTATTLAYT